MPASGSSTAGSKGSAGAGSVFLTSKIGVAVIRSITFRSANTQPVINNTERKIAMISAEIVLFSFELIKKNPCHKAKLPKVYKTEITPLTDQQVHDFLQEAQNDEYYGTILRVILFTGLREGEALGLTWDCVNFKYGTVVINKQLQRRPQDDGGPQLTPTKNGKSRTLRPAKSVMNLLKIRYTEQVMQSKRAGDAWEAWRNESEHSKALVFTNEVGHHLQPKRVYLHFKKIADEIGAQDARVHDLRHTYAVLSLQNGDDVKTASAAFTLDVYGHVSDRMQRASADRMEEYIASISRMKNA